jgi:hypothetical protein
VCSSDLFTVLTLLKPGPEAFTLGLTPVLNDMMLYT